MQAADSIEQHGSVFVLGDQLAGRDGCSFADLDQQVAIGRSACERREHRQSKSEPNIPHAAVPTRVEMEQTISNLGQKQADAGSFSHGWPILEVAVTVAGIHVGRPIRRFPRMTAE